MVLIKILILLTKDVIVNIKVVNLVHGVIHKKKGGQYIFDELNNNLDQLYLSGYNIKAFPNELNDFSNLIVLGLEYNNINTIPEYKNTNLTKSIDKIFLNHNNFKGELPLVFNNFNNLGGLQMDYNQLDSISEKGFNNLSNLKTISLENNNFKGKLPIGINQFNNLWEISFKNNKLSSISDKGFEIFGNRLPKVNLDLSYNNFKGELPVELNQFSKASLINLMNNNITSIPDKNFDNLRDSELDLRTNCISFTPESAKALKNVFLDLNCIPDKAYGLNISGFKNCSNCNNCINAKIPKIENIYINSGILNISYGQYNKGICN